MYLFLNERRYKFKSDEVQKYLNKLKAQVPDKQYPIVNNKLNKMFSNKQQFNREVNNLRDQLNYKFYTFIDLEIDGNYYKIKVEKMHRINDDEDTFYFKNSDGWVNIGGETSLDNCQISINQYKFTNTPPIFKNIKDLDRNKRSIIKKLNEIKEGYVDFEKIDGNVINKYHRKVIIKNNSDDDEDEDDDDATSDLDENYEFELDNGKYSFRNIEKDQIEDISNSSRERILVSGAKSSKEKVEGIEEQEKPNPINLEMLKSRNFAICGKTGRKKTRSVL